MHILKHTNIDFLKFRKIFYIISLTVTILGFISIFIRGFNYSIDFKGGTEIVIRLSEEVPIEKIRESLAAAGVEGQVREYGKSTEIILKTVFQGDLTHIQEKIDKTFRTAFPKVKIEILRMDTVGPTIARDLIRSAIYALIGALITILIYVAFRFELKSGVAAIVATAHDVSIIAGIFSVFGGMFEFLPLEFDQTIIAALLTVAGYSITDTVVVFDRIRENRKFRKGVDISKIFNDSINETLSRTIIVSLTVLFTVIVLFIFAGPVIRGFAFAVAVGIFVGTYSSIFIASPFVLDWILKTEKIPIVQSKKK